jgi:Lon protease-like protein
MADHLEEMPLFPLHAVLFPYASIQLHVFEDRYRSMIHHCLEFERPFGIVLIRSGSEVGGAAEPYMVGTAVRVLQVHTYDDGRMDVRVQGERRFRVRRFDQDRPYLVGWVEPVVELEPENQARCEALMARAQEAFRTLIEGVFGRPDFRIQIAFPHDPTAFSFLVANLLPLENLDKQRLLETTDTSERLGELIPLIEKQILEASTRRIYKLGYEHLREWVNPN